MFLFTACEREIPYNGDYQDPKLVIQALMRSGEDSIVCYVSRSSFFLDDKSVQSQVLEDVTIQITSSIRELHILSDKKDGNKHILQLSAPLQAGDTILLSATHPEYGTAVARDIIMPEFVPEGISVVVDSIDSKAYISMLLPEYPFPKSVVGVYVRVHYTYTSVVPRYNSDHTAVNQMDTLIHSGNSIEFKSRDDIFALLDNDYDNGYYIGRYTDNIYRRPLSFHADYSRGRKLMLEVDVPYLGTIERSAGSMYSTRIDSLRLLYEIHGESYNDFISSMQAYMAKRVDDRNDANIISYFSERMDMEQTTIFSNVENGYGILLSETANAITIRDWILQ